MLAGTYAVAVVWWGGGGRDRFGEDDGKGEDVVGGKGVRRTKRRRGEESRKKIKVLWAVPVVYGVLAGVEAVLAGSVVGLM